MTAADKRLEPWDAVDENVRVPSRRTSRLRHSLHDLHPRVRPHKGIATVRGPSRDEHDGGRVFFVDEIGQGLARSQELQVIGKYSRGKVFTHDHRVPTQTPPPRCAPTPRGVHLGRDIKLQN